MNKIDNIKDCLLIIDVQNDFCAGGALEVPAGDEVVGVINQLGTQFEHKILTQDWHPAGHESFASSHAEKSSYDMVELAYGDQVLWPEERPTWTAGAVLLAGDALAQHTPAHQLFTNVCLPPAFEYSESARHLSRVKKP